jgi:hypothetical protein
MRVTGCVLSTAEVNPYLGRDVVGGDAIGLDPDAVYNVWRQPAALSAAAPTFDGVPLMLVHVHQTADDPQKDDVIGSVYNVRAVANDLVGDLLVTDRKAIELIQSGDCADLSCGYSYTIRLESGTTDGQPYDATMSDIVGNHVAIVPNGRATRARVADHETTKGNQTMPLDRDTQAAIDALKAQIDALQAARVKTGDADGEETEGEETQAEAEDAEGEETKAEAEAEDAEGEETEGEETKAKAEAKAMDAASVSALVAEQVAKAVDAERKAAKAIRDAEADCRHVIGDVRGFDSADKVYLAALQQIGVNVSAIPPSAAKVAWQAANAARGTAAPSAASVQAADAASQPADNVVTDLLARAARIRVE